MRIAIVTTLAPFTQGGAEYLAAHLAQACRVAGHQVELRTYPFFDRSPDTILSCLASCQQDDFFMWGDQRPDLVICLKFPAFYVQHECKVMWILHQHRSVYDLWDFVAEQGHVHSAEEIALREKIIASDNAIFSSALQNFTISHTVSKRLQQFNHIDSTPLYHPPAFANAILHHPGASETGDFIFAPSRFEPLKRQHLLLEALRLTKHPVKAVLCGSGSHEHHLRNFVTHYKLQSRVTIHSHLSEQALVEHYKQCLAVFFAPYDEDYGYVTLEAMLAGKAVISCSDSGGTNEFILPGETGFIEPPSPEALAERLDELFINRALANTMGVKAAAHYQSFSFSWEHVVDQLLY